MVEVKPNKGYKFIQRNKLDLQPIDILKRLTNVIRYLSQVSLQ